MPTKKKAAKRNKKFTSNLTTNEVYALFTIPYMIREPYNQRKQQPHYNND